MEEAGKDQRLAEDWIILHSFQRLTPDQKLTPLHLSHRQLDITV